MNDDPFTVGIEEPQPSQLYLDGRKLAAVAEWFDFDEPNYEALPVVELDGGLVLTDGHTRAFAASLSGRDELRVRRDADDLPLDLYGRCVDWCVDEGITEVRDLVGRVVGPETFEERWIERCHAAADGD